MENSDVSILSYDDKDINLSNIVLSMPSSIQGGSYFTKIQYLKRPLYMQSPTCISKQGIITVGKKTYIDLIISNEKDGEFISFLENLEKTCIDIIFEKRHVWFTDDLEKTDIEMAFASIIKSYKNGTSHLLKLNINNANNTNNNIKHGIGGVQNCFIFDENNNTLPLDHVKPEMQLITIIDFEGIKFTSKSFQFEMNARQILIINEKPVFNSCLIKPKKNVFENSTTITNDGANENGANENDGALIATNLTPIMLEGLDINNNNNIHKKPEIVKDLEDIDKNIHANESVAESVVESVAESVVESAAESVVESAAESVAESKVNESVVESVVESAAESAAESVVESVAESVVESVVESAAESKAESKVNENDQLIEIDLEIPPELDSKFEKIKLQDANDVYYKMYKEAKEKAKSAKKIAVEAYLAAEEIRFTYNLIDNESDSDSDESDSDSDNNNDNNDNNDNSNDD